MIASVWNTGRSFLYCAQDASEFSHKGMCVCAHIHMYTRDSTINKYMYSLWCVLYDLCPCLCVCVCINHFVPIAPLVQSHHIPSYNVTLNQLLVTNVRAMNFPEVKTFSLQMREISSVAMWARRSCQIQSSSVISNMWQVNIMMST